MRRAKDNEKCSYEATCYSDLIKKKKILTTTMKHKEMENSVVFVGIIKNRIKQDSSLSTKALVNNCEVYIT